MGPRARSLARAACPGGHAQSWERAKGAPERLRGWQLQRRRAFAVASGAEDLGRGEGRFGFVQECVWGRPDGAR
eukprot:6026746-Lingulodinium_polyedra.AAC.1